jgi:hypothetical protein
VIHSKKLVAASAAFCGWLVAAGSNTAHACSVCFGDPESDMVQGAIWGVATLVGVITFVLGGVAGTGLYWMHRARRLSRLPDESVVSGDVQAGDETAVNRQP